MSKTVLVVEDDRTISDLIVTLIETEGYETLPAFDGETAVSLAREQKPDLITLDLALPKKDGRAVLQALAADDCTRGIPVGVVSAYTSRLSREDMLRTVFVIGKPVDVDDFVTKINRVLGNGTIKTAQHNC